ncbi:MAG: Asp-tRNA(Asn)/Glu-tRNA(Gln) amidotransferase subunit GatB [Actinomycetales bacterium]|nr:Asp-tRNA(Asn)/Glu-tRNA(Gln) amidotransferase subunit GatB [Actinomycetales bacterium]
MTEPVVDYAEVLTRYEPVLGLEVHVELATASKMFCGCATEFGAAPNTQTCPVCLGLPGALPVSNDTALASIVRIGLALNCTIAADSRFARKNYFYPDMPKDFQISQYDEPLCTDGWLDVPVVDPESQTDGVIRVGIERVHMEEDTGKLTHAGSTGRIHDAGYSLVDYNRSGIPLVEIVTRPITATGALAPQVARAYVTQLRDLLRALAVSDVRMEQGSLRCDVNVSLAPIGATAWGTRTETKNVNSLRSVERAVRYEMSRQAARLDAGQSIVQETRHFHEADGTTSAGRSKEQAEDYRYFPEPDLVPIQPDPAWVARLREDLPAAPHLRREQLHAEWGFTAAEMRDVVNAGAVELIAATVAAGTTPAGARKWWLGELARRATQLGVSAADLPITPAAVARIEQLVDAGTLTDTLARQVIEGVLAGEGEPDAVIAARDLQVVGGDGELGVAVDAALAAEPEVVERIRAGKHAAVGVIVGAVMKQTRGRADAARVRALVFERLGVVDEAAG